MNYLIYLLFRGFTGGVALLPISAAFVLGRVLGWIAYYVSVPYRRLVLANLRIAFEGEKSPAELRRLAREHFVTLGANLIASFKLVTLQS